MPSYSECPPDTNNKQQAHVPNHHGRHAGKYYDDLLRGFTTRHRNFDLAVQAGLAERLARPLMEKLEMDFPIYYQIQYVDVLGAIERRWAEERGVL